MPPDDSSLRAAFVLSMTELYQSRLCKKGIEYCIFEGTILREHLGTCLDVSDETRLDPCRYRTSTNQSYQSVLL
jgi:hypothetical protein